MYRHEMFGEELIISDKAYEALASKWRVGNIKYNKVDKGWEITGKCEYCKRHISIFYCKDGCPFSKFRDKLNNYKGCFRLIRLIGGLNYVPRDVSQASAFWLTKKAAEACVSAVEKELKKFEWFSEDGE